MSKKKIKLFFSPPLCTQNSHYLFLDIFYLIVFLSFQLTNMTPNQIPRKLLFTSVQNPCIAALQRINLMRILSANSNIKVFFLIYLDTCPKQCTPVSICRKPQIMLNLLQETWAFYLLRSQFIAANYEKKRHKNHNRTIAIHEENYVL